MPPPGTTVYYGVARVHIPWSIWLLTCTCGFAFGWLTGVIMTRYVPVVQQSLRRMLTE